MYVAVTPNPGSPPAIRLRELPRGGQDQESNDRQPVVLARRAHRATPRRIARQQTAARRRGGGNRPHAAARPCARRTGHGAPPRARRRAAAPGAATYRRLQALETPLPLPPIT